MPLVGALAGFVALVWFLIRVVPKPSRAAYPCQRAAFPLASAFVLWVSVSVANLFAANRLRRYVPRIALGLGISGTLGVIISGGAAFMACGTDELTGASSAADTTVIAKPTRRHGPRDQPWTRRVES